ncbi:hypothetical protein [Kocuria rhizophila]|uniref:hypothetical protein n=1 Tax=Kocuria rhizophila TaxID=72000 RepID=UPI003D6F9253
MTNPDYSHLTEEELEENRLAILSELEKRQALRRIPEDIKALADQYQAAGGDPEELSISHVEES